MSKWNTEEEMQEGMMKVSKYVMWIGLLMIVAGVMYDVMFTGIPYQDPPDYLLARYNFHQRISRWIMNTGLWVIVIGALGSTIIWLKRKLVKS